MRVAEALRTDGTEETLVLGCRGFVGSVPARSRVGNSIARGVFRVAAGWALTDTQTGLRGIPARMLSWMRAQPGDRFEYEQNVLLRCRRDGWATRELRIETVYLADNASSHFRPLVDSLRIGVPLLLFTASSLLAFVVDSLALLLFTVLTGWLVPSIVAARMLSAAVNFLVNRRMVFRRRRAEGLGGQGASYALLALALLASNIVWMSLLTSLGVPLLAAKVVTELALFLTSYAVQTRFVFPAAVESAPKASLRNGEGAATQMDSDAFPDRRFS
jgi:putative flippase GtrA